MNIVVKDGVILSPSKLAEEANAVTKNRPFTSEDFCGKNSRIAGAGHCNCGGDGEFELLPLEEEAVQSGCKRYMQCTKCGCWSHL